MASYISPTARSTPSDCSIASISEDCPALPNPSFLQRFSSHQAQQTELLQQGRMLWWLKYRIDPQDYKLPRMIQNHNQFTTMRQSQTVPFVASNHVALNRPQVNQVQAVQNPMTDIQLQNMMSVGLMDDFFKDFLNMARLEDELFSFSGLHNRLGGRGEEGTGYAVQVFSSVSSMGPDGQIKNEQYYENSLGHHSGGNTISERQQAYQNSLGAARIAEERRLNDQGRKVIKQKRGGQVVQTNHFYNLDEARIGEFDNRWNQVNTQTRFLQNYGQMAPRQALDFNTVNRFAVQAQQMSQQQPQLQQAPYYPQHQSTAATTNAQTAINTPLLQSTVQPGFQNPLSTPGVSRVSNPMSNTANTINSMANKYSGQRS